MSFCLLCVQPFGYWRHDGHECFWDCARHQEALPWQELEFLHLGKVRNYSGVDESVWGTVLPNASIGLEHVPFVIISFIMLYKPMCSTSLFLIPQALLVLNQVDCALSSHSFSTTFSLLHVHTKLHHKSQPTVPYLYWKQCNHTTGTAGLYFFPFSVFHIIFNLNNSKTRWKVQWMSLYVLTVEKGLYEYIIFVS